MDTRKNILRGKLLGIESKVKLKDAFVKIPLSP